MQESVLINPKMACTEHARECSDHPELSCTDIQESVLITPKLPYIEYAGKCSDHPITVTVLRSVLITTLLLLI